MSEEKILILLDIVMWFFGYKRLYSQGEEETLHEAND